MKKRIGIIALASVLIFALMMSISGCGAQKAQGEGETVTITDSCGREVEIPADISRVAPSGAVAQMVLASIAPEKLVGLANTPSSAQSKYFPDYFTDLPTFGQLYGSKATLNMESLIAAEAQIIIDVGDLKDGHAETMDDVQKQTLLPTIFVETSLDKIADGYRTLGKILGKEEKGEQLAEYIENTIATAKENAAKIPEDQKISVMYGQGTTGLNCNANGSIQADVIDLVGAKNAIVVPEGEISNKGGGNEINMEQIYVFNPDLIIVSDEGVYDTMADDSAWNKLDAVKGGNYYEIPCLPFNWMSNPPSVNRVLGIWWLGNLAYPEIYDYDMVEKAKEFYSLFYDYELTDEEATSMLANSSLKLAPAANTATTEGAAN